MPKHGKHVSHLIQELNYFKLILPFTNQLPFATQSMLDLQTSSVDGLN